MSTESWDCGTEGCIIGDCPLCTLRAAWMRYAAGANMRDGHGPSCDAFICRCGLQQLERAIWEIVRPDLPLRYPPGAPDL